MNLRPYGLSPYRPIYGLILYVSARETVRGERRSNMAQSFEIVSTRPRTYSTLYGMYCIQYNHAMTPEARGFFFVTFLHFIYFCILVVNLFHICLMFLFERLNKNHFVTHTTIQYRHGPWSMASQHKVSRRT